MTAQPIHVPHSADTGLTAFAAFVLAAMDALKHVFIIAVVVAGCAAVGIGICTLILHWKGVL